jgi:SAM-dependent methyltransferase
MTVVTKNYKEKIYDFYVKSWDESKQPKTFADLKNRAPTMNFVIKNFFPKEKDSVILDLGCGHGTLVGFAKKSGYKNIKGVDVSAQQVDLAAKLGIDDVSEGDSMRVLGGMDENSCDMVVTFDVIEHMHRDELLEMANEIFRVLSNGGQWLIHAPNGGSPFVGRVRYGDLTHEIAFTPDSLNQVMKLIGFSRISYYECGPYIYGIKSLMRYFVWKFAKKILQLVNMAETGSMGQLWTRNLYAIGVKEQY